MDIPKIPKVDGGLTQAVSHPLRVWFLRLLAKRGSLSPKEALQELEGDGEGVPLSQVGYHVWILERLGVVEVASRATRTGGAVFRSTEAGELLMLAIGVAPGKT